ncbi:MAG: HlyD family efflux transporter periplasmic adaptor subunit [Candidatus Omnitrophica bacterium]|jgi:macrolide-specific efflux system membrane fusion protein|nr:HlyD family efflux transporter periplasmic adaptor subunit [Candidatus Omnitrophota bacterium]
MRNKKLKIIFILLIVCAGAAFLYIKMKPAKSNGEIVQEIIPFKGSIENIISTTGTVLPKNRLEIMPPVSGRVESIQVREGEIVKAGQTLAWMSSTERAALLDAARGQGEEKLKYWEDVYKAIPLISPIDGEVIVATTQPGQTVATSDAILVLSDQLIVRAQVDETDIGKIKLGQKAVVSLDAYADVRINAVVGHIYYESETVNNVTIYKVDLVPEKAPEFFRSGMNATVDFQVVAKDDALLVPVEAVYKQDGESYVLLKQEGSQAPVKRAVKLGITDDKNYEIASGISTGDTIIVTTKEYILPGGTNSAESSNPFLPKMPSMRRNRSTSK